MISESAINRSISCEIEQYYMGILKKMPWLYAGTHPYSTALIVIIVLFSIHHLFLFFTLIFRTAKHVIPLLRSIRVHKKFNDTKVVQ